MESSSISSSSIEVKVISCNHLKAFNFFQKLSVYAVVSIVKEHNNNNNNKEKEKQKKKEQKQRTPIDREGDGNPQWNHTMRFDLKEDQSFLLLNDHCEDSIFMINFDLRCEGIVFGKKTIGRVRVPIKDLMEEEERQSISNSNGGAVRFVSYQVRTPDGGKPNGILHFSYKIIHIRNDDDDNDNDGCGGSSSRGNNNNNNNKIEEEGNAAASASSPLAYHPQGEGPPHPSSAHNYPSVEEEKEVELEPPSSLSGGVHYPSIELEPLPPPFSLQPQPQPQEPYYSAPEFYYTVPPAPPPSVGTHLPYYYPPPPHPLPLHPLPPLPFGYHAPPIPYGYGLGSSYGYDGLNDHSASSSPRDPYYY